MMEGMVTGLIKKHKTITNKIRPKTVDKNRSHRTDIDVVDDDGNKYTMFIRQTLDFNEDFSVGLRINPPNPVFTTVTVLVRFQGPHGGQSYDLHNSYHYHILTDDDVENKRYKPNYKAALDDVSCIEEAVLKLLDYCNIDDPCDIFNKEKESVNQISMDIPI